MRLEQVIMITPQSVRGSLAAIWCASFVVAAGSLAWMYTSGWIESDNFTSAFASLNSLCAPYIGILLSFYFAQRSHGCVANHEGSARTAIALGSATLWNLVLLFIVLRPLF